MANQFNISAFLRDLYLASTPSIDLNDVKEKVRPGDYRIPISKAEEIERKHGAEPGTDLYIACGFLILNQGPQLVQG